MNLVDIELDITYGAKMVKDVISVMLDMIFLNFFYTEKETRRNKLNKINKL
jgi:hypothetical protein